MMLALVYREDAMLHRSIIFAAVTTMSLLAFGNDAHADAIDGDWCRSDGQRMTINGPEILTPGGQRTRGKYDRHHFSYEIPAGEPGAGEQVAITLLSEYLARAQQGGESAPLQEWRRCQPGVS